MLLTLFLLLIIVSFVDGLYLIYRAPSNESDVARLIACYYVNVISLSVCVYGAMIHAKMHVLENKRTRLILWSSLTAVWCISLFLGSNLMVLLRVQWSWAAYVLHSQPALIALYGIACGMCLRMQAYFFVMKQDDATNTERKDIVLGVIVYLLALAQSIGTSLYI